MIACCLYFSSVAQRDDQQKYTVHTVAQGETFETVAARYKLSGEELASYNNLDYYDGPLLSKTLKVPTKKAEVMSSENKVTTEEKPVEKPLVVEKKEEEKPQVQTTASVKTTATVVKPQQVKPALQSTSSNLRNNSLVTPSRMPAMEKMMPLIIFLSCSFIVLIVAIFFYRSLQR